MAYVRLWLERSHAWSTAGYSAGIKQTLESDTSTSSTNIEALTPYQCTAGDEEQEDMKDRTLFTNGSESSVFSWTKTNWTHSQQLTRKVNAVNNYSAAALSTPTTTPITTPCIM
jgi:hypothetical protein